MSMKIRKVGTRSDLWRTHYAYRRYLIRWSIFTLDKPDNKFWVEKDDAFICWANTIEDAKQKIDDVAG